MAPAGRLQLQLFLPDVYNFNGSCQTSTTSTAPTIMVPRPRHGTLMTPGPNVVLYCLHLFYKTLLYPSISKSDPNCHSPIRPRQNVTPQFVPDKMSLPKSVPDKMSLPKSVPDKMSLPNSSQTNCHSPVRPGQNVTPQFAPDKMSLPNSPHSENPAPKMTCTENSRTELTDPPSQKNISP